MCKNKCSQAMQPDGFKLQDPNADYFFIAAGKEGNEGTVQFGVVGAIDNLGAAIASLMLNEPVIADLLEAAVTVYQTEIENRN